MEALGSHRLQPVAPVPPEQLPLVIAQRPHRQLLPVGGQQLSHQRWTYPLIGPQQGLGQGQGQQADPPPPTGGALLQPGWLASKGGRIYVVVAGADRPQPGLLRAHLAGQGDHPHLAIEQQQVAVATHQFGHQPTFGRFGGPPREGQLHHPLPTRLLDRHQGQTAQTVLQLLGQGAAIALARGRIDAMQPSCIGLPAQLQPMDASEAAQAQLDRLGIGLLGLFKATGQQIGPPFR